MRFQVFHRTRYNYRHPVQGSYNELRLRPVTVDKSRLEFFLVNVQPPVRLQHFRDSHYNYVHYFEIAESHNELVIEAQSTINTTSPYANGLPAGAAMSSLRNLEDDMLPAFLQSSKYVDITPDIWKLALDITAGCQDVFEAGMAIRHHLYTHWTYAPNTTTVTTRASEVLEKKGGVCQDFAHLMTGLCRAVEIPARYVSGYLYNGPGANLRGAQASHAWCEIFVPGHGWFGLDPTNDTLADERYIKIATGRDYMDAAPVSGHYSGSGDALLALLVDLRIEELPA